MRGKGGGGAGEEEVSAITRILRSWGNKGKSSKKTKKQSTKKSMDLTQAGREFITKQLRWAEGLLQGTERRQGMHM